MANKYLLDTHALIWYQGGNSSLSTRVIEKIQDKGNDIFFSQFSIIEIAIKQKIGKLPEFKASIKMVEDQAVKDGFTFLNIENHHISCYESIPFTINIVTHSTGCL